MTEGILPLVVRFAMALLLVVSLVMEISNFYLAPVSNRRGDRYGAIGACLNGIVTATAAVLLLERALR